MTVNWKRAACRRVDPEAFFPLSYQAQQPQVLYAKSVCRSCPILDACQAYVEANPQDDGIWAGQTPRERRRERTKTFTPTPAPAKKPQQQWASGGCTTCGRLAIRIRGDKTLAAHSRQPGRLADDMTCPGGATTKRRQEAKR